MPSLVKLVISWHCKWMCLWFVGYLIVLFCLCSASVGIDVDGDVSDSDGEWIKLNLWT